MTEPASLTAYVAEFIIRTKASSIPAEVMHLGKRSILDGLGLALAGAASETGRIIRRYLDSLGIASESGSTVIGGDSRLPARFAAFANGVSIHADDYDDTQLAIAKDRVYGLLTHPTAPALPAVLALAGNAAESGHIVRTHLKSLGIPTDKGATVIGTNLKVPARFAAFANGIAIHADDYDDTQLAVAKDRVYGLLTHPTAPALPPVLALGETGNRTGLEVLTAYQVSVEAETKISEAINPRHYDHGFHSTATIGAIAAAAGAARMMGLNLEQTRRALGIGASQSAGLRENFGTMTKPFHPGRSAESGIVAAEFAKLGWTATPIVLEAGRGFFKAAGGGYDPAAIEGKLGNPWTFAFPGVSIKPHPSGSLTHPGMGLMLDLIRKHDIRPELVAKVKVGTNRHMPNALIHHRPTNELQAKFSMEFCMAILLLERKAGLAEFTDKVVNRANVKRMIEKIEFGIHPEAEAAGYEKMTTIIDIELTDGRKIGGRADFGKGSPVNPMTDDELAGKFRECAAWGKLPGANADKVVDMVFSLEKLKSIRDLTRLLAKK